MNMKWGRAWPAVLAGGVLLLWTVTAASGEGPSAQEFRKVCAQGTAKQVRQMLDQGVDVNAAGRYGLTALIMAATGNSRPDVLEVLLAAGADVNAVSNDGYTALMGAALNSSNPEIVTALAKAGAALETRSYKGKTALMLAAFSNPHPEIVQALLSAGADINAQTANGSTPLMEAAFHNANPRVIEALLSAGADINAKDHRDRDARWYAQHSKREDLSAQQSRTVDDRIVQLLEEGIAGQRRAVDEKIAQMMKKKAEEAKADEENEGNKENSTAEDTRNDEPEKG